MMFTRLFDLGDPHWDIFGGKCWNGQCAQTCSTKMAQRWSSLNATSKHGILKPILLINLAMIFGMVYVYMLDAPK